MSRTSNTRAAQGSGTIRQRKDGRWEARYTVGRDPGTGKQIQRSIYGASEKEVLQKLQRIQIDITDGTYTEPSKLTVAAWLDIWLKDYTGGVKERTRKEYKGTIEHRIKPALGKVKLSVLKPHQVQGFYNDCQRGTSGKRAISPKTIKNLHGILHKAFAQAMGIGYLKVNPTDACKLPRIEKKEINPLDETQIAAFLKEISGHQFEICYTIDLFTGMRQGEILGLTWDCVNLTNGTISVQRQLQYVGGGYKLLSVKNDRTRMITPAPYVIKLLQEQKRKQAAWRLLAGSMWDNDMNLVFTNEFGKHLARETVYANFKRIVRNLGIGEARFHDLRHSYAVASLQSGDDVKTVQENLGHHTAAFTLDIYGHVTEKMKQDSAARMEQYIKGVTNL